VKLKITNDCGSLTTDALGLITIYDPGVSGPDLIGKNGVYSTVKYPLGIGTWMTTNSKEGNPTATTYKDRSEGERGYYYNAADAPSACPEGWGLPPRPLYSALRAYLVGMSVLTDENAPWVDPNALAGQISSANVSSAWDVRLLSRVAPNPEQPSVVFRVTPSANDFNFFAVNATTAYSVRCMKMTCDEAPYIVSSSFVDSILPIGVPIKMYVTARSVETLSYTWSVPAGARIISGLNSDTLMVQFDSQVSFNGNQLSVRVANSCGQSTKSYTGLFRVVDLGSPGENLVTGNETYQTYVFPAGMGTWMTDCSKEGNPTFKQYEGHEEGARGYYYLRGELDTACPEGWTIPNKVAVRKVYDFLKTLPKDHALRESWLSADRLPGHRSHLTRLWEFWDTHVYLWSRDGLISYNILTDAIGSNYGESSANSVRCIKVIEE
jgi:hypothetical protein